uniref:Nitrate reductase n=1 Tax=uncultured bacterium UPO76 TaxID=1776993 RepID=A0A140DZY3_9BACT|nr:nitrate reductase [uncultured bacterium UPO76]
MEKRANPRFSVGPAELLRQHDGPLTRDLLRTPGRFGLGQLPARLAPDATARVVCGYCSTGCRLVAHLRAGEAVNLSPDPQYPVNLGMACPKGWQALAPLEANDRLQTPLLRNDAGRLEPVSWPVALQQFASRFRAIAERDGPEAMAFLSTGQIPTEEMVFLGALAKFGMGMVHGDGNTRQCMATAAVAYKEAFGFDAPPYSYADFEESDVIVLVGSNLCIAHPILWERICRNRRRPEIVVVDPRRTETAMAATQHYAIRPKSDLLFFYAIANVLLEQGWIDHDFVVAHTEGLDGFRRHVEPFTPEAVAPAVGLEPGRIRHLAETIGRGERVSFWWTMGVNQGHEAVRTAQALINLALLTGNMGGPGTGANSITGQCNAMGSRLFSNTTCLFGGRDFEKSDDRAEVARILGIDPARIPSRPSLAYDQILEAVRAGRIRALWVVATNTAHSWIHQNEARETLRKLEVLVVQDLYATTETAQLAHLVLPAAGWGEKDGTFINSERRIGTIRKLRRAPGQALADFHIFRLVADAWGCGDLFAAWQTPEDVFRSMQELSRGQPCDITGIDGYRMLEAEGGVQWPLQEGEPLAARERRLFADGRFFRDSGRARFCFESPRALPEAPDTDFPFVLLTGRGSSSQWHTETRTAKSPVLRKLYRAGCWVEIHPKDAERLEIEPETMVRVVSRRGALEARALLRETVHEGEIFIPMHAATTNRLTDAQFDPYSRQPAYKHCAVRVERLRPEKGPSQSPREAP